MSHYFLNVYHIHRKASENIYRKILYLGVEILPELYFLLLEYLYFIQYNSEYILFFNQKKTLIRQRKKKGNILPPVLLVIYFGEKVRYCYTFID